MPTPLTPHVAIIGGGPVGLTLAIELARQRVPAVLIERSTRPAVVPKANFINVRSMEIFRRLGVRDAVRAHSLAEGLQNNVLFGTRLLAPPLSRMQIPSLLEAERIRRHWRHDPRAALDEIHHLPSEFHDRLKISAEFGQRTPQNLLEPVLKQAAEALNPAGIRFGHELLDFEQHEDHVALRILDCAAQQTYALRAPWMVACDGASSPVRKQLGIRMLGEQLPSTQIAMYFESPGLAARLRPHGGVAQYFVINADSRGVLVWSGGERYVLHAVADDVQALQTSPQEWMQRLAGGRFAYRLIDHSPWKANLLSAERYRCGRVFLAGDAAHLVPPTGGFGMNTGLQDAMDLGWKLGAVYHGWAGAALLDAYDHERQQAFRHFHDECRYNLRQLDVRRVPRVLERRGPAGWLARRAAGTLIARRQRKRTNFATGVFGYHYRGSPVLPADASAINASPAYTTTPDGRFVQKAVVGYRAPHRWLGDAPSAQRCLFDECLPDGYTLIVKQDCAAAKAGARTLMSAARALGIPVRRLALPSLRLEPEYGCALTLLRPDHHVAWQGDAAPAGVRALWRRLCGR